MNDAKPLQKPTFDGYRFVILFEMVVIAIGLFAGRPASAVSAEVIGDRSSRIVVSQPAPQTKRLNTVAQSEGSRKIPLSSPERRLVRRAHSIARRLERQSTSSFERGLMGLADYAEHLKVVRQLRSRGAKRQGNGGEKRAALVGYESQLARAVRSLERFGQPGSKGWAADVAYARLLRANARVALAENSGDSYAVSAASRRSASLAQKHFNVRLADFRMGLSTLPQLQSAAAHLSTNQGTPSLLSAAPSTSVKSLQLYRETLKQFVTQTETLSQRGAGLGRDDRLQLARFELSRTTAILERADGNLRAAKSALEEADDFAGQVFETQWGYYGHGTARLFDLTQSWRLREALHDNAQQAGYKVRERSLDSRQTDFERLLKRAQATTDRRGRKAADTSLVAGLNALAQLKRLR